MGKYRAYSEYKGSGIEWLGDVPSQWDVLPVKFLVSTRVTDGPHETPEILDAGVPFISAEAISSGIIDFTKKRGFISETDHIRFSKKYKPECGDIYMIKSGATTGRMAMVETDDEFNIWSPLAAIRCDADVADNRFVFFYMQSHEFQQAVELGWNYGTQQNIGMGVIENIRVLIPTITEQSQIAAFLDRETAKIDRLIAKQEALIELLKEKRQAVISHAVTKGLDPDAPMKDSGVEWLGEIPAHWSFGKLKRRWNVLDCKHITAKFFDEGYPLASISEVKSHYVNLDTAKYTNKKYYEHLIDGERKPEHGDIIYSRNATVGEAAIVSGGNDFAMGQDVCLLRSQECDSEFFYYVLHLEALRSNLNC